MLLGITTGGKIGLGLIAGLFIAFALVSSFVLPRRNPDFPGNRVGLFSLVTFVLFAATIAGVFVFAKESEEGHAAEAVETHGTETGEEPATTEQAPPEAAGDAEAGEAVFASAGCGGCHVLEAAGAAGAVGPSLDDTKPDAALVVDRVTNGKGAMPSFSDQLDEQQIQDVAAYVVASTQG